jgi:hypothetical protein
MKKTIKSALERSGTLRTQYEAIGRFSTAFLGTVSHVEVTLSPGNGNGMVTGW